MAHVNVTINGRQFRMACDDGQEDHLHNLAAEVNAKVEQLKGAFGEIGDTRLTVMAAIMTADEVVDMRRRLESAEAELTELRESRGQLQARAEARETSIARALDEAAATIERVVGQLNASPRAAS
ncbi:cell division protein ZapA [Phreatobacter sp. AB_2022a]|uniref:cell division protein ZapA n=1 Tax=Phreatobacter sp. AB_2022a TaxID=3003134 RepID=UPI002286F9C4|nr:cell division protein ZapA [Phreatobacter sp. AB_2022a]MCZ0734666.1 cell division protein ZapA [Phreatobacter sp. AB_2022a]